MKLKPYKKRSVYSRLLSKVCKDKNGCWNWTDYLNHFGYGRLLVNGKKQLSHRVMWQELMGKIPEGMLVLHKCDNPKCVNINHLFLGDSNDNIQDCIKKDRRVNVSKEQHGMARLTSKDVCSIRKLSKTQTRKQVAKKFRISLRHVYYILSGKNWHD